MPIAWSNSKDVVYLEALIFGSATENEGIWSYNIETKQFSKLPINPSYLTTPVISPDGKYFVYGGTADERKELHSAMNVVFIYDTENKTERIVAKDNNSWFSISGWVADDFDESDLVNVSEYETPLERESNIVQPAFKLPWNSGTPYCVSGGAAGVPPGPIGSSIICGIWESNHDYIAIDFDSPNDVPDPVRAVAAGTVTWREPSGGYGNLVKIRHDDGTYTFYAHLDSFSVNVGDVVQQGCEIGDGGDTGLPPAPGGDHIHFEWRGVNEARLTNTYPVFDECGCTPRRNYRYTSANSVGSCGGTTCPPSAIAVGQTVNGTLQNGDCQRPDTSFYDAYTFNGTTGQQIFITLNSSQFNAFLFLFQGSYPGGTLRASDNNGGGGLNARIPATSGFFTLPTSGTYTILANSLSPGESGNYELSLGGPTCNPPGAFSLNAPGNGQSLSSTTSATLSWGNSPNADSYDVYFGTNSNPPFLANQPGTSRTVTVTPGQTYWWKVVAKANCTTSTATTATWQFSIQLACNAPGSFSLTSPSNGQSLSPTTSVDLTWGASANANSYDVYFGTSSNPPLIGNQPGTSRTVTVTPGQTYWWKIVARVSCGASASTSAIWSFSVQQSCTYSISPETTIGPEMGSVHLTMVAPVGCSWSAVSNSPWLTTSSSGSGNGPVSYDYIANPNPSPRVGHITVGGRVHTVTQLPLGGTGEVRFQTAAGAIANESARTVRIPVIRFVYGEGGPGTVVYSTSDGTAIGGLDYIPTFGTLYFGEFETLQYLDVVILEDTLLFEADETFTLSLSNPSPGFMLGSPSTSTVTIINDQNPRVITGTVTYGNASGAPTPRFVSNVTISGEGSPNVFAATDFPGGNYLLGGFGAGSYTVTPSKTDGVNGAISSFDAARIAQHVAGLPTPQLDPTQLIVADVSGNSSVTSFDAGMIAKFVAGPPYAAPGIGQTAMWKFNPVSRNYVSVTSTITGEDYSALLMGEVSGNWTNTGARPAETVNSEDGGNEPPRHLNRNFEMPPLPNQGGELLGPERGIAVEVPSVAVSADKEIVVPINVEGIANKNVISYEFDLRYDPSVIQPLGDVVDVKDTASRGLSVVTNSTEPGLLRVVVYGAMLIDENGVLLNLRFTAIGASGSVSPLTFERIMFNEGEPMTATNGEVRIEN